VPTVSEGREGAAIASAADATEMEREVVAVRVGLLLSAAMAVNDETEEAVGVPEIAPVV